VPTVIALHGRTLSVASLSLRLALPSLFHLFIGGIGCHEEISGIGFVTDWVHQGKLFVTSEPWTSLCHHYCSCHGDKTGGRFHPPNLQGIKSISARCGFVVAHLFG